MRCSVGGVRRSFGAATGFAALLAWLPAQGQDDAANQQVAKAAERWLATDHVDDALLDATVKALGEHRTAAIAWLAPELQQAAKAPANARSKGVQSLATRFAIDQVRAQRETDLAYVGQYDLLLPLQPFVGDLFFELLTATPQWYPLNFRGQLIAPLRDLQPRTPSSERLDALVKLVEDGDEDEGLRRAIAAALWQWGTRQYAEAFVQKLRQDAAAGDGEDRVNATLWLGDYFVLLREHKQAAIAYRTAQVHAQQAKIPLRPIAFYATACTHALLGDVEKAFTALDECTKALASPDLDESLRLKRSMFDDDPDLALLRKDARFAPMVARAFPPGRERTPAASERRSR